MACFQSALSSTTHLYGFFLVRLRWKKPCNIIIIIVVIIIIIIISNSSSSNYRNKLNLVKLTYRDEHCKHILWTHKSYTVAWNCEFCHVLTITMLFYVFRVDQRNADYDRSHAWFTEQCRCRNLQRSLKITQNYGKFKLSVITTSMSSIGLPSPKYYFLFRNKEHMWPRMTLNSTLIWIQKSSHMTADRVISDTCCVFRASNCRKPRPSSSHSSNWNQYVGTL